MPLAFTQEDFLVTDCPVTCYSVKTNMVFENVFRETKIILIGVVCLDSSARNKIYFDIFFWIKHCNCLLNFTNKK